MKTITLLLSIIFISQVSNILNAQKIKEIDKITFNETEKLLANKKYKNSVQLNSYKTKSGNWLKVGDTLIIGKPSNSLETNHNHIFLGSVGAMLIGTAMPANETMTGDKIFITKIYITRLSRRNPFKAVIEFNKVGGGRFLGIKKLGRANLESALESGEIINGNRSMTRKEAIAKLKEAKELMEIEMISKEDFESLKIKLTPIIKGN